MTISSLPRRVPSIADTRLEHSLSTSAFQRTRKNLSCSALWDTGANATVVSERVATALGLAPVGMVTVHTANGPYDTPIYAIDVMLPNNVMVKGIRATEADLQICDALIGMDIISLGDMLVTNAPNTKFEFRLPSKGAPTLA